MKRDAADLKGPKRQCERADGDTKKIHGSKLAAEGWLRARNNTTHEAYKCAEGHWHIGTKRTTA